MSRSMASASAKNTSINHKYQQTTPTIEASLRAGVVIGHRMSQNRAQQEENHHNESPTQLIESPRNK